jgi:aminoglycoside phosphotransferase (APT) family kinase protein
LAAVADLLAVSDADTVARLLAVVLDRPIDPERLRLERPTSGGWSNDTIIVELGDGSRVVVRLAPARAAMFPVYDLRREHDCLHALAGRVPVPPVLGADLDGDLVGRPAFVMGFVDGRVPSDDRPTFAESGWLHDAESAHQREFHESLLGHIAAINAVVPSDEERARLLRPGASACAGLIDDLQTIWRFDTGAHRSAVIDDVFAAVRADVPADPTYDGMLWGDARPANAICEPAGFLPVALVDFELAAWGPAELDVTWLAEMDRMRTVGSGVEPLPGFLDDDEAVACYERHAGRELDRDVLRWATLFNALKVSVLMHRHLRVMVHEQRLPAGHRLLTENVSTRRCVDLLAHW